MASHLSTEPYKGVRDFYPSDWAREDALFTTLRTTMRAWGYEEYQASPLERTEIYESKGNEEILREQTYTFIDRGDRKVTLRPEMTPSLARMVAGRRRELAFPLRWFSIGNRFRYERPQKGRMREFFQCDVDLLGLPEGEADIEILLLATRAMQAIGAAPGDFALRMNSRPLLNAACTAAGLKSEAKRDYLRLLDKKEKMPAHEFEAERMKLSEKDPLAIIEHASDVPEVAIEKKKILDRIEITAKRGAASIHFDPTITRGFDYYTGMVFEVFDTSPENTRALFGGGRYDGLVALFGGEPIPAVGFAIGTVPLMDFIETHKLTLRTQDSLPQLYLGTPSAQDIPAAQDFADKLRIAGCRVFVNITEKSLGDQIKDAVKRGIPFFSAYGADEIANNSLRIKTLATGVETGMTIESVPKFLAS